MPFFLYWTSTNLFACLCWLVPTLLVKTSAKLYAFQKEFVLASSNLFQSELKIQWLHLKGIQIVSFTLNLPYLIFFIPQPICPESYTLLAFWFMQEYGEKEMDNKMVKKPTDQSGFNGFNKYTNGSHGYPNAIIVCVLFPTEMWHTWRNS